MISQNGNSHDYTHKEGFYFIWPLYVNAIYFFFWKCENLLQKEKNNQMCSFGGAGAKETLILHSWHFLSRGGTYCQMNSAGR